MIICAPIPCRAQDSLASSDSTTQSSDDERDDTAQPDTMTVAERRFDQTTVNRLKEDPELKYDQVPTIAESIWDRFKQWIRQLLNSLFDNAVDTNWGKLLTFVAGLIVVIAVILMILKVNAFKVLYRGEGAQTFKHNILDENIHAMDFEKLIQDALSKHDYRLGVRLVFLYSLKLLSDKNHIHFDQGKTNHDYLEELSADELKNGFNELNFYFEYAWYGNFTISHNTFSHVQLVFNDWKRKL